MKATILLSLLCSVFLASTNTAYAFELVPHHATYTAKIKKGITVKGKAVRQLSKVNEHEWHYSFNVKSFAADIKESVSFSIEEGQLKPSSYYYKLSPFLARNKKRALSFDWTNNTVTSTAKKNKWQITDIPDNTYDRLGYQLQLLLDIDKKGLPIEYKIAHKAKLRPSKFDILGEEIITTTIGTAEAIVVKKIRSEESKRQTTLWVSKQYPMILLKMLQIEKDGEEYEINVATAQVDGKPINLTVSETDTQSSLTKNLSAPAQHDSIEEQSTLSDRSLSGNSLSDSASSISTASGRSSSQNSSQNNSSENTQREISH